MAPSVIKNKDGVSKIAKLRFKKRKESIMKMAKELSVLCDIKVCALVSDPDNGKIETWPQNSLEVEQILKEHVLKNKKVGKGHQDKKQSTSIVGDHSFLKIVDQKLASVQKRIERLKNMKYNEQNQSFFIHNFHGNFAIKETLEDHDQNKSMNCNTGAGSGGSWIAPPFVQNLQSGFSAALEPMPWSSSQFTQTFQSIETELLGDFEEFGHLLQSMPDNTIIGEVEALNTDATRVFPYQQYQMEDYWVQENTTDDEIWAYLQGLGLDSILQTMDGIDYQ
ncbi:hypothetical protein LIER_02827 [Lithospermum erythrorhizon]|uniref:MADS-box domain-containing protein n=1 Tax=Lithospermum erythrorhizon TaxID=34254 RepID=A0AAV3NQY5_LITER